MYAKLFTDKKNLHIDIDRTSYIELRKLAFEYGISMQQIYNEIARLIAAHDPRMMRAIEEYVMRKIHDDVQNTIKNIKKNDVKINELDHDTIYNLIDEGKDDDDEDSRSAG